MALGDLFYEAKGRIIGQRVLDTEGPKIETTVSYDGIMKRDTTTVGACTIGVVAIPAVR